MTIRDEARTAFLQSRNTLEQDARNKLFSVLPLTTEISAVHLEIAETYTLYVFTDITEDVHIAARKMNDEDWKIYYVEYNDPDWVLISKIKSLAELGEILPPETTAPDAWVSGNVYSIGDIVSHNGNNWESTVDTNVWEPGVAHSVWVIV